MRDHVRVLGWCFIIHSAIVVMAALGLGAVVLFGGANALFGGDIAGDRGGMFIAGAIGAAIAAFLLLVSLPGIFAGMGLLHLRPRARIVAIIVGVLYVLSFPLGTALSVYTLWVLLNRETEARFRGEQVPVAV
jgi:hypothetical protein